MTNPSLVWPDLPTGLVYPTEDSSEPLRCSECGELIRLDGRPFSWDGETARHEEQSAPRVPRWRRLLARLRAL
jgi:hypothetical protein